MTKQQAIEHLQKRLGLMLAGHSYTWTLKDRAAVSLLCIDTIQQNVHSTLVTLKETEMKETENEKI